VNLDCWWEAGVGEVFGLEMDSIITIVMSYVYACS
jgi:hypothetical protein